MRTSDDSNKAHQIKVMQAVYSMNRGGVESWLMHVLRQIDRRRFQIDFVTFAGEPGELSEDLLALGSRVFSCAPPSRPWRHRREFKGILQKYGPYDVVHSHAPEWNGPVLGMAKHHGVAVRIAHNHNDVQKSLPDGLVKCLYTRWSINQSKSRATHGFACSRAAAESYFGKHWENNSQWKVLYCSEDFTPFSDKVEGWEVRKSLAIPEGATVVGHVGSFRSDQKNHEFLVRIADELTRLDKNIYFLLVGDGALRPMIEQQVAERGLQSKVVFAGVRSDVPRLLLGAMDLFLFPSLYEGLGLVLVEAQAAGLPCVYSDAIPQEADVAAPLLTRLSLSLGPEVWSVRILRLLRERRAMTQKEALEMVLRSDFNISNGLKILEGIYSSSRGACV